MVECRGFSMNTIKYWYGASVILLLVMACYSLINIEKQLAVTQASVYALLRVLEAEYIQTLGNRDAIIPHDVPSRIHWMGYRQ